MQKVVDAISSWAIRICAVLLVVWVLLFVVYILGRNFGLDWRFVEEFTGYWLVLIVYSGLAYALITETHITVDVLLRNVPQGARRILRVFTDVIGLAITCYLLGRSIEWVIRGVELQIHSETSYHVILWPTFLPIPIGLTLFTLTFIVKIGKEVTELVQTKRV